MLSSIDLNQKNFPLQKIIPFDEQYISRNIFDNITKSCTFPPIAIEEINSELWCYSYDGYGKVTFKDGSVYTGGTKFGVLTNEIDKSRPCQILFSDGEKYIGEIKDNILSGEGQIIFPSGNKYEGGISYGLRHGHGIYRDSNGLIYEGDFVHGIKEGYGRLKKGSITYEGTFHNGMMEGYGRLSWDNGDQYEGEFKNNKINGVGTMLWAQLGEKYTGQWRDNKENGFGIYIWYEKNSNSKTLRNRYIGYWINGVREGYGVFFYSNDTKYEGFWENNEKNGFGVFRFKNGTTYIGDFIQDKMINYLTEGIVRLNLDDGNYYDYDDSLDRKYKRGNYNLISQGTTSAGSTIEAKRKSVTLPPINSSKREDDTESNINNSKLEVIMENENSKLNEENEMALKSKKYLLKNSKNLKKDEKMLSYMNSKAEKNEAKENVISPKELYNELEKKKQNIKEISELRVMKDQNYLASNRMINEDGNNQILSIIDLSDIFDFEIDYEQTKTEVSNCILRNISEFTRVYNRLLKLGSTEEDSGTNINKFFTKKLSSIMGDGMGELNESAIKPYTEQFGINNTDNKNNENNKENDQFIIPKKDNMLRFNLNLVKKENQILKSNTKSENNPNINNINTNQSINLNNNSTIDQNNNNIPQQKKNLIESVPLNPMFADDKIGTCLELKDIWKFFRDYGIIGEDLTIAQFDRIFYRGKKNLEEMFLIPEELPRRNIYKFLELMVRKSEEKFKSVHEKHVKFTEKEENMFNKSLAKKNLKGLNDTKEVNSSKKNNNLKKKDSLAKGHGKLLENNNNADMSVYFDEEEGNNKLITFDFHNHHNPVLLRQFYEALIRAAYQKYYNSDMKLYKKIELLIKRFSTKSSGKSGDKSLLDKSKTKKLSRLQTKSIQNSLNNTQNDLNTSSVQMPVLGPDGNIILSQEQKNKNEEHIKIDKFITKFAVLIRPIFLKLFYIQNESNNFHKENTKVNEQTLLHRFVFNNFVKKSELISKFFGKKEQYCEYITYYFREKRIFFKTKLEQFKYYESLLDLDMIFYEFCEFIYLVCNKNIVDKKLSFDDDNNFLEVINHLNDLINLNKDFKNKIILKKAKYNYQYPILKSHLAKKIQEDEKIRYNQIKLIDRIEKVRYTQERQSLKENDENMNPKEDNEFNQMNTQEDEENSDDY